MRPEPLPAGSRKTPPLSPQTRNAAAAPSGGSALIDLRSKDESLIVADSFRRLGWRVEEGNLMDAVYVGGFDHGVHRRGRGLPVLYRGVASQPRRRATGEAMLTVLVEESDESVGGAWRTGADWVVARPFDPNDPMKVNDLLS